MKRVLVAGATGYLGQFVVKALRAKGYWIRALGRSAAKLAPVGYFADAQGDDDDIWFAPNSS